jgi:hypothetical protein
VRGGRRLTGSRGNYSEVDTSYWFLANLRFGPGVYHQFRENVSKIYRAHHFSQRVDGDVRKGVLSKHFSLRVPVVIGTASRW